MTRQKRIPKNYYNPDFIYVKKFLEITATKICKKLNVNRSYVMAGYGSDEIYKLFKEEIESEFAKLYIKKDGKQ